MFNHTFHIPVMGTGFTIDTPAKVAHLGISSVVSLLDDVLIEKMRKFYSQKFNLPFLSISEKMEDFRARRTTAYLNLLDKVVKDKYEQFTSSISEKSDEIQKYFQSLPNSQALLEKFKNLTSQNKIEQAKEWFMENFRPGSIDVNIMTKLDKENYSGTEKLETEFNDAHAAIRGFANSTLNSAVVLSAGMNPALYGYLEKFDDFYPNLDGSIKKRTIIKVSDFRSAQIQGKYLARKGLWVSEYRIESGLNCGGHAFADNGKLIGPVLEEFKNNRATLQKQLNEICLKALQEKGKTVPSEELAFKISAQGGIGTSSEHDLLLDYYGVDSVGWGSPFLLVPEAVNMDDETLEKLCQAEHEDISLSNISPLGVKFNSLTSNTKDQEKKELILKGTPGSRCLKRYASLSREFGEKPLCTASRAYQAQKIKELDAQNLSTEEYQEKYNKIVEKSCICVGLGTTALLVNGIDCSEEGRGVSVCPGPNLSFFKKRSTVGEMIEHIYGKKNLLESVERPHLFVNELKIYIDYLQQKKKEMINAAGNSLANFENELKEGISYYKKLYGQIREKFKESSGSFLTDLQKQEKRIL